MPDRGQLPNPLGGATEHPMPLSELQIDSEQGVLSNGRDTVVVGQRGAAILSVLRERVDEAVPKHDLIDAGWPGYVVEEGSLSVQIASLRRAMERLMGGALWIVTVPRVGYRLLPAPLSDDRDGSGRWAIPTLAILPVTVLPASGADIAADAVVLADTLTAVLSVHGGLSVAPRSAARLYAETRMGTSGIAGDLGVRFLVEGSLTHRAGQYRVSLQLADAVLGRVIWSDRFDLSAGAPLDAMDAIAGRLVDEIDTLLVRGEEVRTGYPAARNLAAWTHYIRGLGHAYWPRRDLKWGHEMSLAIAEWERALALDPDHPALLATLGAGHAVLSALDGDHDAAAAFVQAAGYLDRALTLAPDQPLALAYKALLESEMDRFDAASDLARRAIRLAPHAPAVCTAAGFALCAGAAVDEAVSAVERALTKTPYFAPILTPPLARIYRSAGRLSEAIRMLEEIDRDQPKFDCRELVICYMQAGQTEEAVNAATRLLLRTQGFTIRGWRATQHRRDEEAIHRDMDALRAAGLPE